MSASGYKQTYSGQLANVCFTPKSGHSEAQERLGLKKRTLGVRFTPESGHSEAQERVGLKKRTLGVRLTPESGPNSTLRWMSAYDPKATCGPYFKCPLPHLVIRPQAFAERPVPG